MCQNGGQAKARNEGVRHARGRYVAFLDSDDWLDGDALENVVEVFERNPSADCVWMRVIITDEQFRQREFEKPMPMSLKGFEAFEASLDWNVHGWYVTRRDFYERWPYDETCKSYSDDNVTHIHFFHSREVHYAPKARYYYRTYSQSVTQKPSVRRFDYLRANESMKQQLQQLGVEERIIRKYENHRWLILVGIYMFYHVHGRQLNKEERSFGLSELHRVWNNMDRSMLDKKTTAKFGYCPCKYWWIFRLQEWFYFTLRGLLGKNY